MPMSNIKLGLLVSWPTFWTGFPIKMVFFLLLLAAFICHRCWWLRQWASYSPWRVRVCLIATACHNIFSIRRPDQRAFLLTTPFIPQMRQILFLAKSSLVIRNGHSCHIWRLLEDFHPAPRHLVPAKNYQGQFSECLVKPLLWLLQPQTLFDR